MNIHINGTFEALEAVLKAVVATMSETQRRKLRAKLKSEVDDTPESVIRAKVIKRVLG